MRKHKIDTEERADHVCHRLGSVNEGRLGVEVKDVIVLGANDHSEEHTHAQTRDRAIDIVPDLFIHKRREKYKREHKRADITECHPSVIKPPAEISGIIPRRVSEKIRYHEYDITYCYINF